MFHPLIDLLIVALIVAFFGTRAAIGCIVIATAYLVLAH